MLNGMKIIKRWSPATMFSSLLLIIAGAGIGVSLALLPWATIFFAFEASSPLLDFEPVSPWMFTGYDFVKDSILYMADLDLSDLGIEMSASTLNFFQSINIIFIGLVGEEIAPILTIVIISVILVTIILVAIAALTAVISGLIGLLSGRKRKFGSFSKAGWSLFAFVLIESLIPILLFFILPQVLNGFEIEIDEFTTAAFSSISVDATYQVVYISSITVIAIVISVIYGVYFKNGIYVKNLKALEAAQAARRTSGYPGFGSQSVNGYPEEPVALPTIQPAPIIQIMNTPLEPSAPKKVSTVQFDKAKGLPDNLTAIGGHSFSQNTKLEVAIIPPTITKIGPSAFANCINLQVVSIPKSVTDIGYNAFFGCKKLVKINYNGRKSDWRKVKRGSNWLTSAGTTKVVCLDGPITVNPYH